MAAFAFFAGAYMHITPLPTELYVFSAIIQAKHFGYVLYGHIFGEVSLPHTGVTLEVVATYAG
jgi:hypothetical protein